MPATYRTGPRPPSSAQLDGALGPPVPYDRAAYARRHRVENFWARMKEFRAVATRYDKTAAAFRAGILIAATLDWLKG